MNKQTKALLKENNALEARLDKDTVDVLTDIVVYLRGANISEYNQELARRDITNMLIEGQERGQSAREVIGDDYKAFCDAVIAEMPQMTRKERVINCVQTMCGCFGLLLLIWTLFNAPRGSFRYIEFSLGDIISAVMIVAASCAIVAVVTKKSFAEKKIKNWAACLLFGLVAALCVMPSFLIRRALFTAPTVVMLIISLVLMGVDKLLDLK